MHAVEYQKAKDFMSVNDFLSYYFSKTFHSILGIITEWGKIDRIS